jgi:cytochrome c biogenesis protein CcdA
MMMPVLCPIFVVNLKLKNMVHSILNFILGTAATAGTVSAIDGINPSNFPNLEELIKYVISIFGGILATIIINILKKKFPEWFQSQKKVSK